MDSVRTFLRNKKNASALLLVGILALAIPLGVKLIQYEQQFFSRADVQKISVIDGDCVSTRDGKQVLTCGIVPLKLIFPVPTPSPTPTPTASPVPTSTASSSASPSGSGNAQTVRVNGNTGAAIQAALDLVKISGGAVYVPAGTYTADEKIRLYSNTTLFGDGPGATIIQESQAIIDRGEPLIGNDSSKGQNNIVIRDLTMKGLGQESGKDRCCEGLRLAHLDGGYVINLEAKGFSWNGIYIRFLGEGPAKNIRVSGCKVSNNKGAGIAVGQGENIIIDNCESSGNNNSSDPGKRDAGINLEIGVEGGIKNSKVLSSRATQNANAGISLKADSGFENSNNAVCNNTSTGNGDVGIADAGGTHNIYIANSITGNQDRGDGKIVICDQSEIDKGICNNLSHEIVEDESSNATNPTCSIPPSLANLPPAPAKPTAYNFLDKFIGKVSAQDIATNSPSILSTSQCADGINNDFDALIDAADPECHKDGNADNAESYDASIKFESRQYRLAELEKDLNATLWSDYKEDPLITEFGLNDASPGAKQIWVQFRDTDGKTYTDHLTIDLVEKDPIIKSVSCNFDSLTKQDVRVTIKGARFTDKQSSVLVGPDLKEGDLEEGRLPTAVDILDWKADTITILVKNLNFGTTNDQRLKMAVLRQDLAFSNIAACDIGKSQISLGAKVFCRDEGNFATDNVKVSIFDKDLTTGKINRVDETASIDKDGVISGLKTQLQSGKRYVLSIKAPYSVRRNAEFIASEGTTIVTRANDQQFILPVGDIAPTQNLDGKINSLDKAELSRQWKTVETTESAKEKKVFTGDFNSDTKVNSFDWACMRYDFNGEDDPIPTDIENVITTQETNVPDEDAFPTRIAQSGSSNTPIGQGGSTSGNPAQTLTPAYLALDPSSTSIGKNCSFSTKILVDTNNKNIDGVDAVLIYDPNALSVVSVTDGSIFEKYVHSIAESSNRVSVTGISFQGASFSGKGTLATINFKVKPGATAQSTTVRFDFDPQNKSKTTDSNIVERTTINDLLNSVGNGTYQITETACQ